MAKRVLCVGAAVLDTIFRVRELPRSEGKVLPYDMLQVAEGMASSAAFAIVRLGGKASLWGSVGDDATGERIRGDLSAAGIDVCGLIAVPGARSAVATILVDDGGERVIVPFYDPKLHEARRDFADKALAGFGAVLVDVRWPDLGYDVLAAARRLSIPAILDGDVAPLPVLHRLGAVADHIIFSEPAAASWSGLSDAPAILRRLATELPDTFLCVTVGAQGSYWRAPGDRMMHHQPTLSITAVDTLAAGDAFHGAFALASAEGMAPQEAVRFASACAALKCQVFGGRIGMPNRRDVAGALASISAPASLPL